MAHLDPQKSFEELRDSVISGVKAQFPVKGRTHTLHVDQVEAPDSASLDDIRAQHKAKVEGQSWSVPVYAHMRLVDNATGKDVESKKVRVAEVPRQTKRYSYIVDGEEYQVDNQWQLKPGVYTRRRDNGELESQFNVTGGRSFDITFVPSTKKFVLDHGKSHPPLYPFLKLMGVSDDELEHTWGKDILAANKIARGSEGAIEALYKSDTKKHAETPEVAAAHVVAMLTKCKLRPDATVSSLGKGFENVTGETLKLATQKILAVHSGHPEDNRDSLLYKDLRGIGDFAHANLTSATTKRIIQSKLQRQMNKLAGTGSIRDIVRFDMFNEPVKQAFKKNQAVRIPSQINPVEMLAACQQTTVMGPGGIQDERSVSDETKLIDASHFGFLDPIKTSEGCFRDGTEVYTKDGWVDFATVDKDTLFACIHRGGLSYYKADALQAYRHTGDLYCYDDGNLKYAVTPDHRMRVRSGGGTYKVVPAKEVHNLSYQVQASKDGELAEYPLDPSWHSVAPYDGMVYCATVPGSFLYVRLDGKVPFWCGNSKTGITLRMPIGVKKVGKEVKIPLHNLQTHAIDYVTPAQFMAAKVVLSDQVKWVDGKPVPRHTETKMVAEGNKVQLGNFKDAQYVMKNSSQMFNIASNLIPFLGTVSGNRASYASNHIEQSISLKHREAPLVQSSTGSVDARADSFETLVGRQSAHLSPVDGVVHELKKDAVVLKDEAGKKHEVQIYHNFPLNDIKGMLHSTPTVKVGDKVTTGQVVADNNFTRGGTLALGTNVRVAYLPYKGYNFEDGIVISETASKKLTSEHLHKTDLKKSEELILNPRKFVIQHPGVYKRDQLEKLDDEGVIKVGQKVHPGDPLIVALKPQSIKDRTGVNAIRKGLSGTHADASQKWEHDVVGEVVGVHKSGDRVSVHVRTTEPMQIGDKMCFDAETEVFTSSGWKPVTSVTLRDSICCLSNGEMRFSSPTAIHHYRAGGNMYQILGKNIDLLVTDSHKMFVWKDGDLEPSLVKACDVYRKSEYKYLAPHEQDELVVVDTTDATESLISDYDKPVYCVTVPGHVLYVRRNGKAVWSGNSGRYGNKGTCTRILPDDQMPHTADGKPIEVCLNPTGVGGRMNVGQILETSLSKVAEKTGKPYLVKSFEADTNQLQKVKNELKAHGLEDTEHLFDPITKEPLGKALVGKQYMLKLVHQIDKKVSVRAGMHLPGVTSLEKYDTNLQPGGGSGAGGQRMDPLGLYGLLAHGAKAFIREGHTFKSEGPDSQSDPAKAWPSQHNAVWAAIQTGSPLPTPKPSFAFHKFTEMLKGAGINMEKQGHQFILSPLTDKNILSMSSGALPNPADLLISKTDASGTPKPKPGGLFDEKLTGGHGGKKWSHIELAEPIPNPIFRAPVCALLGMKEKDFDSVVSGEQALNSHGELVAIGGGHYTGGYAIEAALKKIDVDSTLEAAKKALTKAPTAKVDRALKKVKYLQALQDLKMAPHEAYVLHHLPIMPPAMRPISMLPDGNIHYADVNELYKSFAQINDQLKDPMRKKYMGDEENKDLRHNLYDGVRALMGLGIPGKEVEHRGILDQISGTQPKCYDAETEILTKDGWVKFPEYNSKTPVATVDLENGNLEWQVPQDFTVSKIDGELVHVTGQGIDLLVTLNHRHVVQSSKRDCWELVSTESLELTPHKLVAAEVGENFIVTRAVEGISTARVPYTGLVYGPTVENGTLVVRRNGIPAVSGNSGYFQKTLMNRRQDMTMRSTVVPEPALGLDELGLPKDRALKLFAPFVVKKLTDMAAAQNPLDAQKEIASALKGDKKPLVWSALDRALAERPVIMKRDPALHKYSVQGFRAKAVEGTAIQVHPLITGGFNMDFDGDQTSIFVPVHPDAVAEAKKMMPSNNLFHEATGKVMYQPSLESALGLYKLSCIGTSTEHKFATAMDSLKAVKDGKLKITDLAHIDGVRTTPGRVLLASVVPVPMQKKLLEDHAYRIDKKGLDSLFSTIGKNHLKDFPTVADDLKNLGNGTSTGVITVPHKPTMGLEQLDTKSKFYVPVGTHTLSLNDLSPDIATREAHIAVAQKKINEINNQKHLSSMERDRKIVEVWGKASEGMKAQHVTESEKDPSGLFQMYQAGIKPGWDQYKQLTLGPMLMEDAQGKTVMTPVTKSYAEGLDVGGYWTQMHGARRGTIMKVVEVQEPGFMNKLLINNSMHMIVNNHDCGTQKGIDMPLTGNKGSYTDAIDRYLAKDVKIGKLHVPSGTLLDVSIADQIRAADPKAVVHVRSTLHCEDEKGLCQKCVGPCVTGGNHALGTNIGVLSAQALGERATQLSMKQFHCMHPDMVVLIREGERIYTSTLGNVFNKLATLTPPTLVDGQEEVIASGLEISDNTSEGWTRIKKAIRHPQHRGSTMCLVRTESGKFIISQDNHPHMLTTASNPELHMVKPRDMAADGTFSTVLDFNTSTVGECPNKSAKDMVLEGGMPDGWGGYTEEVYLDFLAAAIDELASVSKNVVTLITDKVLLVQQVQNILCLESIECALTVERSMYPLFKVVFSVTDCIKDLLKRSNKISRIRSITKSKGQFCLPDEIGSKVTYKSPLFYGPHNVVYDLETETGTLFVNDFFTHNTGGSASTGGGSKVISSFGRLNNLMRLPQKIADAATLAMHAGTITKMETDTTGTRIWVGNKLHHVGKDANGLHLHTPVPGEENSWAAPKVGMRVNAGDLLSDPLRTVVNPHTLYKATGSMEAVQYHLADEVDKLYREEGIRRRAVETVVKSISNLTKVDEPHDHPDYLRGQYAPLSVVNRINKDRKAQNLPEIEHTPTLKGVDIMPHAVQEDWMARLQHNRLEATLMDAAATRGVSDIHGAHPIPGMAYGAEFGLTAAHSKVPGFKHLETVKAHHY